MFTGMVTVKSTSSPTVWKRESKREWSKVQSLSNQQVHIQAGKEKARVNGQRYSHCQINKFTYRLKIRKQERMVKGTVTVKSTSSRTNRKRESKREWSKVRSLSNQQVHVQPGKEKARENGQRYGHCQINKFTYKLEKRKQERMVKGMVTVKSTGSCTVWKRESKREWSKVWSLSNQ